MKKLVHRYKDTRVPIEGREIIDMSNGEIIPVGNSTLFKRTSTREITINSKEYVYIDTRNLSILLSKGIKQVDLALLFSLSNNLLINYNICLDNTGEPLNTASIAKLINNTTQSVKRKLKRLINQGLLYYGTQNRYGKVYIINPYIIRKGRKLNGGLSELFDDIE
jgi:hypothetical protein